MARLVVFDTETSGVDPQVHSILSLGAVVWEDGRIVDEFEIQVAEPQLTVEVKALAVNRINLVEHSKTAVPPEEAMKRFREFLSRHFPNLGSDEKVPLAGHNVAFDVGYLKQLCRAAGVEYGTLFSHRTLDTAAVLRFLNLANKIDLPSAGSEAAFKYFGIVVDPERRHTALADARATAQLLNALLARVR